MQPVDSLPINQIEELQLKLINQHLDYIYLHSDFYKNQLQSESFPLQSLDELQKLPVTTKEDIAQDNYSFFAANRKQIVEFVTTSGTLGKPISIALTQKDLDRLSENERRSLSIAGITDEDTVQITTTLDKRFIAGLAYYLGATNIGATVIRTGVGQLPFQWENIETFQVNTLVAVPTFLLKMLDYAHKKELDVVQANLKKAICIGEPVRKGNFELSKVAQTILEKSDIELFSTYASTETATAFTECEAHQGGHLLPELAIVEVLDENNQQVKDGELGEVTITPLGIEGTPLLRYKTGDLARLYTTPCSCGRTTPRLGPVEGRKKQMIKLKGTSIFPNQIEEALHQSNYFDEYVIQIEHNYLELDQVTLILPDDISDSSLHTIRLNLKAQLRVAIKLEFLSHREINNLLFPSGSRKPQKIIDLRNQ